MPMPSDRSAMVCNGMSVAEGLPLSADRLVGQTLARGEINRGDIGGYQGFRIAKPAVS